MTTSPVDMLFLGNYEVLEDGTRRRLADFTISPDGEYTPLCGDYSGVTIGGVPGYCSLHAGHVELDGSDHRYDNGASIAWTGDNPPVISGTVDGRIEVHRR